MYPTLDERGSKKEKGSEQKRSIWRRKRIGLVLVKQDNRGHTNPKEEEKNLPDFRHRSGCVFSLAIFSRLSTWQYLRGSQVLFA